jgi:hypothetical protein
VPEDTVPPKTCSHSRISLDQLLKDADGLVQLSNMQLRLALELRRKAERLAKPRPKSARKKRRDKTP